VREQDDPFPSVVVGEVDRSLGGVGNECGSILTDGRETALAALAIAFLIIATAVMVV
jgi:hypothetical protein